MLLPLVRSASNKENGLLTVLPKTPTVLDLPWTDQTADIPARHGLVS